MVFLIEPMSFRVCSDVCSWWGRLKSHQSPLWVWRVLGQSRKPSGWLFHGKVYPKTTSTVMILHVPKHRNNTASLHVTYYCWLFCQQPGHQDRMFPAMRVTSKRMKKTWRKSLWILINPGVPIPCLAMVLPTSTTFKVKIQFDDDFCKDLD